MTRHFQIHPTPAALCEALAASMVDTISELLKTQPRCSLVLSGGSTPKALFQELAKAHKDAPIWGKVDFFWGDERFVLADDARSNNKMAREHLLAPLGITEAQIFPMPTTEPTPDATAQAYEATLREYFSGQDGPVFDILLLGMGTDGHTASLFPGTAALQEETRWVVEGKAPDAPTQRISLTLPAINHARRVYFLLTGDAKGEALAPQMSQPVDASSRPTGAVAPKEGELIFWLDQAAANHLPT